MFPVANNRDILISVVKNLFTFQRLQRHLPQGAKFIVCGVTGLVTEVFFLLPFLIEYIGLSEKKAGLLSGFFMLIFVFFFNKYITFKNREQGFGRQTMKFLIVYGFAFVFNYAIYIAGLHMLGEDHYQISKIIAIGVVAVWNYTCSHLFVFRQGKVMES